MLFLDILTGRPLCDPQSQPLCLTNRARPSWCSSLTADQVDAVDQQLASGVPPEMLELALRKMGWLS